MTSTEFSDDWPPFRTALRWRDEVGNCFYLYLDPKCSGKYALAIERMISGKRYAAEYGNLPMDNTMLINTAQSVLRKKMQIAVQRLQGEVPAR